MANNTFEANIYTPDWSFIAVLKDYISIVWTDRYYEVGDFELELPLTKENLQIYSPDNYIVCNQSDKIMIIEEVITSTSGSGYRMKVKGHSAECLLKRRVIPNELIINNTNERNELDVYVGEKLPQNRSHFAGALRKAFNVAFIDGGVETMSEANGLDATSYSSIPRKLPSIRFVSPVADPFGHIKDAIGNIDAYGEEYYEIIQSQCEAKDIGFAIFRNFEREIDRSGENTKDIDTLRYAKYMEANTPELFDLVLYDGWNKTGKYLADKEGIDMETVIDEVTYQVPSGIIFSVEYLNLQSSDSNYSIEDYKNYIFVKGDEVHNSSSASVDVAEATANFTQAFTDEDTKYYLVGNESEFEYGIFRRETFMDGGISRGNNTRRKYADRLRAKGSKELKNRKPKWVLSCEISNVNDYIYREDYYLGDLVLVKDSMDNLDVFRITEEIISCDAAGLKIYPTLVLFDEDKYVADDSREEGDNYARVAIEWNFDGGLADYNTISNLFSSFGTLDQNSVDPSTWPLGTVDGTIIGVKTKTNPWNAGLTLTQSIDQSNFQKIQDRLIGVITYNQVGDYIIFPSEIGDVSNDPNILGDYNIAKEHYELRYWNGAGGRFIKFEEQISAEEGTECYGPCSFTAHWSPIYYKATFKHGTGGHFGTSAFSESFCHINEIERYQSEPPTFEPGKYYEKTRDWFRDPPYYKALYSEPYGWRDQESSTYYTNYYMNSKELDEVIKDVAYNTKPSTPYCVAESGYTRDKPEWDPEIVPALADATYTARWKTDDDSEDEEDGDDDDDWSEKDREEVNTPVKHHTGKEHGDVYIGDEEENNLDYFGIGMVTFRCTKSRLFDKFGIVNGRYQKIEDGPDQKIGFYYVRPIGKDLSEDEGGGSSAYFHAFWGGGQYAALGPVYGHGPKLGICITRADGNIMAKPSAWDFNGIKWYPIANTDSDYKGTPEVAFTNAPVVKKITGYKMLTSNPISEGSESWPQNKIYKPSYNSGQHRWVFTVQNSKPSDWDTNNGWKNYCKKTQIGAKYGFTAQAYDDLGLLFTPLWIRLGIIDHPIIPFATYEDETLYDNVYTTGKLDIASALNRSMVMSIYNNIGWKWETVPDGRWYGRGWNAGYEITGNPPFICSWPESGATDWGPMFQYNDNGTWKDVTVMPDDWGSNMSNYRYRSGTVYDSLSRQGSSYAKDYWGPVSNYPIGTYGNPNFAYVMGHSKAGIRLILPKAAGDANSLIVTITGWTQEQHVKPGKTATFKVNAFSFILSASISYKWVSRIGGGDFTDTGATGSSYSFVATEDMSGMELKCIVTASYSAFDETITGEEEAPHDGTYMRLVVDNEGSDGTPPSEAEKEEKEKQRDTKPANGTNADPPSGNPPSGGGGGGSGGGSEPPSKDKTEVTYPIWGDAYNVPGAEEYRVPGQDTLIGNHIFRWDPSSSWTGLDPNWAGVPRQDDHGRILIRDEGWVYYYMDRSSNGGNGGSGGNKSIAELDDAITDIVYDSSFPINGTVEEKKDFILTNLPTAFRNYYSDTEIRVRFTQIEIDTGIRLTY